MATFTNKATLSFNGGAVDSNTVTGSFLETLALTKTALSDEYTTGSAISYAISLVNSGSSAFTGLSVVDDLGAYSFDGETLYPLVYAQGSLRYYVNGVLQPTPTVSDTEPLTVGGLSVPAGGNAMLLYSVEVSKAASPAVDATVENTVTVSGGGLPQALTASATVSAEIGPQLSITKALSPSAVTENGSVTYTFVISNAGNADATAEEALVVSDLFDPVLAITSVTLDGVSLAETTDYVYDASTGSFATVSGRITVPAATVTQASDGSYVIDPGQTVLSVSGTL